MTTYQEIFDNDWDESMYNGIIVHFNSKTSNTTEIFNKLDKYFNNLPKSKKPFYIVKSVDTHNFIVYLEYIEGFVSCDSFKSDIKKTVANNIKIKVDDYDLTVFEPNEFDTFYHFLFYCIEKCDKYKFQFTVDRGERASEEIPDKYINDYLNNTGYIENQYNLHDDILQEVRKFITKQNETSPVSKRQKLKAKSQQIREAKLERKNKDELKEKQFIDALNTNYEFTKDEYDCIGKAELCELGGYHPKCRGDTMKIANILISYGVIYDGHKQIKKKKGVFMYMKKKQ